MEVKSGTHVRRTSIQLSTDSDGNAEGEVGKLTGYLVRLVLVPAEDNPLESAGTVTVTKQETGELVAEGTVEEFSPDGTGTGQPMVMAGESLAVTVENGGDTTSGTLFIYWR